MQHATDILIDGYEAAEAFRIPVEWLLSEADAGRLPAIRAGKRWNFRFNPDALGRRLIQLAEASPPGTPLDWRPPLEIVGSSSGFHFLPDAAVKLEIDAEWLRAEASAGRIPYMKFGPAILFHLGEVTEAIEQQQLTPPKAGILKARPHE